MAELTLEQHITIVKDYIDHGIIVSNKGEHLQSIRALIAHARALSAPAPQQGSAVHTDHPLRHWDRTCPACIAEAAPEQQELIARLRRVANAVMYLTNPEDQLSCIPSGPERDELQQALNEVIHDLC